MTVTFRVNGKAMTQAQFRRHARRHSRLHEFRDGERTHGVAAPNANYPRESDAMGCHADDVQTEMASLRRAGIPTEITPDGTVIVRTRGHDKALQKYYGLVERS